MSGGHRGEYFILCWYRPRVRSARRAQEAIGLPEAAFSRTEHLRTLASEFQAEPDVREAPLPGKAGDRMLVLALSPEVLPVIGPQLAVRARELGLVVFDPQLHQLVEPRPTSAPVWPRSGSPEMETLRSVATMGTLDVADDSRAFERRLEEHFSVLRPDDAFPRPVSVQVDVPRSMRFLMPISLPPSRQLTTRLRTLLKDLTAGSESARRAAASELGGWGPREDIDDALVDALQTDADPYVRALAALSLAVRSDLYGDEVRNVSAQIVATYDPGHRWFGIAAATLVLASAIHAVSTGSAVSCGEVLRLAIQLELVPGEESHARDLQDMLAECLGR